MRPHYLEGVRRAIPLVRCTASPQRLERCTSTRWRLETSANRTQIWIMCGGKQWHRPNGSLIHHMEAVFPGVEAGELQECLCASEESKQASPDRAQHGMSPSSCCMYTMVIMPAAINDHRSVELGHSIGNMSPDNRTTKLLDRRNNASRWNVCKSICGVNRK